MGAHSQLHRRIPESHRDILEGRCTAVCCTLRADGMLSANPVSIHWDGDAVRFSTLKDRFKYRNLRADSRIALCITDPEDSLRYIEIRGRVSLEDDRDRSFVNGIAKKYMGVDEYPFDPPGAERVTVTVHPEQISTPLMGRVARKSSR